MDSSPKPSTALFEVYLRLRPSFMPGAERFLDVEDSAQGEPTHITIRPPVTDHRKRAIEKFGFTRVFEEDATQLDLFQSTGLPNVIAGVLGDGLAEGKDGLLATLGVTGSGKTHTILGSRQERGLTQMSLDTLYKAIGDRSVDLVHDPFCLRTIQSSDASEAVLSPANVYLEQVYGDSETADRLSRAHSRAATPMRELSMLSLTGASSKKYLPRLSALPQTPAIDSIDLHPDPTIEYAVLVSMYEVYNDRIFDLLDRTSNKSNAPRRRGLLFKSTELSSSRKLVAGLRKIICCSLDEALLVLETGLADRTVAGTGSNATSSRSHGFFCIDVLKRSKDNTRAPWVGNTLTVVDLAGSERARLAKTAGSTLAEAGKINESLMYLGQCMQMQSDNADSARQAIVPFRQCKLTELLFSNSFPTAQNQHARRSTQRSIMVVTADPLGDFNATSQILRYSALAKEVTVPRIPSVTSTIISASHNSRPGTAQSGRTVPSANQEALDQAVAEISHLREQLDISQVRLQDELQRRREAERSWQVAESRMEQIEQQVREEVWQEMESQAAHEQRRWRAARDEETVRMDEHLDKKLEILARGIQIHEDPEPSAADRIAELEDENQSLRDRLATMDREKGLRTPSRKLKVLKPRKWEGSGIGLGGSP